MTAAGATGRLRARDLRAVLEGAAFVALAEDLDDFTHRALQYVRHLIPSDVALYGRLNPAQRQATFVTDPPEACFTGAEELLGKTMNGNPPPAPALAGSIVAR